MTKAPAFSACPYCDGKAFLEIIQSGTAYRVGHVFKSANVVHLVCRNCSSVIHSRVQEMESLLTKAEKEGRE